MQAVAIDFETANESRTSACAIGIAWIERGDVVATEEHLIRPRDMRFASRNIAIHGITPEDVAGAPLFSDFWPSIAPRFDGALVLAHNASFDISVLRHTLDEAGLPWPVCDYLCTVTVARRVWPSLPGHRLNDLAGHLDIPLDHHHAGSDAAACARIALEAARETGVERLGALADTIGITPGRLMREGYTPCQGARRGRWGTGRGAAASTFATKPA